MRRNYSRLESVEEKRNIKRAILFIVLTICSITFLVTFGLGFMAKFASFFSSIRKTNSPLEKTNITPPAPPSFDNFSETTNKTPLEISGRIEIGNTVVINFNSLEDEILADNNGQFSTKLTLVKGENTLFAYAKDAKGNSSKKTTEYKIVYDNEPPKIDISSPSDGASFYGKKQQNVSIKGSTDADSSLTINDRLVSINDDGSFSYDFVLSEGENNLTIKTVDKAGNETQTSLKLNFSP